MERRFERKKEANASGEKDSPLSLEKATSETGPGNLGTALGTLLILLYFVFVLCKLLCSFCCSEVGYFNRPVWWSMWLVP